MPNKKYRTLKEAAHFIGEPVERVRQRVNERELPSKYINGQLMIPAIPLNDFYYDHLLKVKKKPRSSSKQKPQTAGPDISSGTERFDEDAWVATAFHAGRLVRMSPVQIHKLSLEGKIRTLEKGNKTLYLKSDLETLAAGMKMSNETKSDLGSIVQADQEPKTSIDRSEDSVPTERLDPSVGSDENAAQIDSDESKVPEKGLVFHDFLKHFERVQQEVAKDLELVDKPTAPASELQAQTGDSVRIAHLGRELKQERELHKQDKANAQQEISQLDAEITKLRSDLESEWAQIAENAKRAEELQVKLEEERNRRLAAEKLADLSGSESKIRDKYDQQLANMKLRMADMKREYTAEIKILEDDLEEERTKRLQSERRADDLEDKFHTPKTTWQSDREIDLEHDLALEREGRKQDNVDAQHEIDQLNVELEIFLRDSGESSSLREESEKEKSRRINNEKHLTDLMSKLESNEARRRELEKSLSLLEGKVLRLEKEASVLNEVRKLLGAEAHVQVMPEEIGSPKPSIADDPSQQDLLLKTPFGQRAFHPPFPLTDREVELLRLVAGVDEITAEQIRKRIGRRRAVEDLNELLDRLETEGANPIKEINDRYSFHPDNLPSE